MDIRRDLFDGKKVLIFGFGMNGGGLGTLAFLLETGASQIVVTDQKEKGELFPDESEIPGDNRILWHLGGHREADFIEADIIIKNPRIAWDHPLLLAAQEHGAEIFMDSTIFMALCQVPVIGVTGSKGKTTTASLIAHILEKSGYSVVQAGISQIGVLSEFHKITPESVVVFELSSWRLSGLKHIQKSPYISVLTNLYPDHLDYYENMEAYAADKKIITDFQTEHDYFILPQTNEWSSFFREKSRAQIKTFGSDDRSCAWQDADNLWIRWQEKDEQPTLLIRKKECLLSGKHFFENMLAAALAAKSMEVPLEAIQNGLATFQGIAHRFELVREKDGIRYINDTTATIPSAALASVSSLQTPVILLAGGSDKGIPLDDLVKAVVQSKKTILFEGSATERLILDLPQELQTKISTAKSMEDALAQAKEAAQSGDAVLLSPGAASFGMFKNEFDRGEQFVALVRAL